MPSTTKVDSERAATQEGQPLRRPDPAALAKLLEQWMQEDKAEQQETFDFLRHALDEDRPVGYKLFP